ncbi:cytochrome c3 family protein [Candidatus Poribacteria bacterium]|nr:cytochrome c3 family protein [Candidatus Poribacteria bacterium]
MRKLSGKNLILLFIIISVIMQCFSFLYAAGIVESGHNMLRQFEDVNKTDPEWQGYSADKSGEGASGVCSFCHIPHSSSGEAMFYTATNYSQVWGEAGTLCAKCHFPTTAKGLTPSLSNVLYNSTAFGLLNHPIIDDNTDAYFDSAVTVGNEAESFWGGTQQWMSGWPGTGRDHKNRDGINSIECTSCHDVHSITPGTFFNKNIPNDGTGASMEFLRAKAFDTTNHIGNTSINSMQEPNPKQIFCEYCHVGRGTSGWGPYNTTTVHLSSSITRRYSTHPVGVSMINGQLRKVRDDNKGWESSIVIPDALASGPKIRMENPGGGHLGAVEDTGSQLGYDTTVNLALRKTKGVVICQTCHKVHKANPSGQYNKSGNIASSMFSENIQDLLAIDNRSIDGFNKLCEECHSYKPFLKITANNPLTGDTEKRGHPLRHNKYSNGTYKKDTTWSSTSMQMVACEDNTYSPDAAGVSIPLNWPTGGNSNPVNGANAIVCLTCHDVHGGVVGTKLLRAMPLCGECHDAPPRSLGISHPVNVPLKNTDGSTWPDQADLILFTPQVFNGKKVVLGSQPSNPILKGTIANKKYDENTTRDELNIIKYDTSVKIGCDTCHDWTGGNIHYEVAKRRDVQKESRNGIRYKTGEDILEPSHIHKPGEDVNHNSELCVSCHTRDNYNYDSGGFVGVYDNRGIPGVKGANPAPFIMEYPRVYTGRSIYNIDTEMELVAADRQGTHAAQLRVVDDESVTVEGLEREHRHRLDWVYWKAWDRDTTNPVNERRADAKYRDENKYDDPCAKMLSGKRSKWGQIFETSHLLDFSKSYKELFVNNSEDVLRPVIICQSCHTPHYAAAGLVEYNSAGTNAADANGVREPTPHTALLYATQAESFMCRMCHFNGGNVAHPLSKPSDIAYRANETDDFYNRMNIVSDTTSVDKGGVFVMRGTGSDTMHEIVLTREEEEARSGQNEAGSAALHLRNDSSNYYGAIGVHVNTGPLRPANFPRARGSLSNFGVNKALPGSLVDTTKTSQTKSMLVCDSCHAPHAAGTPTGTYILEGNDASIPKNKTAPVIGEFEPYEKRIPDNEIDGATQPIRSLVYPTCLLCHPQ